MALDLGSVEEDMRVYEHKYGLWFDPDYTKTFAKSCSTSRALPMTPKRFDGEILPNLQFSQEDDRKVISGLYAKTFAAVIGCAEELNWRGIGWKYELRELTPALVMASKLWKLDLSFNDLRGGWCVSTVLSPRD